MEHDVNAELVSMGDREAFATAMLKVWRNEVTWMGRSLQWSKVLDEYEPFVATSNPFADQAVKQ